MPRRARVPSDDAPSSRSPSSRRRKTSPWCAFPPLSLPSPSPRPLTNPRALPTQLVELKNGETFNGHLVNCDNFMNITLREVYQTNADGDVFWKLKECYIRGSTVRGWRL